MNSARYTSPTPKPSATSSFLLVGNASYQNRGCEAIVRGTVDILSAAKGMSDVTFTNAFYAHEDVARLQRQSEVDHRIDHLRIKAFPEKWSWQWLQTKLNDRCGLNLPGIHSPLDKPAATSAAALEIGGDNYTMDYGFPEHLLAMDRWLSRRGQRVVIWGASIGPFSENGEDERRMMQHLRSLPAIFVRESATFDYLVNQHGLSSVHLFPDPAFAMKPKQPSSERTCALVKRQPIAVNISPLLAAYRGSKRTMPWKMPTRSLEVWSAEAAEIVARLQQETDSPILLLPHVWSKRASIDDFTFLQEVHRKCSESLGDRVLFVDESVNAMELKWLVSKCRALVAARTHATIAAFSTAVPTISIGYSRKALGINQDVFDTTEFCLKSNELSAASLTAKVRDLLRQEGVIRKHLLERGEQLRARAIAAGPKLLELLGRES